jgi:hypothetical protein
MIRLIIACLEKLNILLIWEYKTKIPKKEKTIWNYHNKPLFVKPLVFIEEKREDVV